MVIQFKQAIYRYYLDTFGDKCKPNWSNLRRVPLAYREEPKTFIKQQVIADLMTLKLSFFYDGKLQKIDCAKSGAEFLYWLRWLDFDDLIAECEPSDAELSYAEFQTFKRRNGVRVY